MTDGGRHADASARSTLSLVLDAAVVNSSIASLVLVNHRRLRMAAGQRHLHLRPLGYAAG